MQIDLPDGVAAVRSAFERYEQALVSNNVAEFDTLFHHDVRTIRLASPRTCTGMRRWPHFAPDARRRACRALARKP